LDLEKLNNIYFLGIGGIGMSALARYFNQKGVKVCGYDKTPTGLTAKLEEEGIEIHFDDDIRKIPANPGLVVYTPAIPSDLAELIYLRNSGVRIRKRAEILGLLSRQKKTIAVSGTHGKTTISTMIAHLMTQSVKGCNAFLGGISKNYNTNFLSSSKSEWLVVEADEYDKSFLQLEPEIAVITAADADHLDIYGDINTMKATYKLFAGQVKPGGKLLIKKGIGLNLERLKNATLSEYSLDEKADYYAGNIRSKDLGFIFDFFAPGQTITDVELRLPGLINLENAVAALSVAVMAGLKEEEIKAALPGFTGNERRFDIQFRSKNRVYIDDYAHHPEELKGVISSVRNLFPGKKILGIFQPHLYSRTKDFADGFAKSLAMLDSVILLPVYPAREKPIAGVDSAMILRRMISDSKQLCNKDDIPLVLLDKDFDILLTLGAGDIDQLVNPIKSFLNEIRC
jgi:UDP-N-acetylmuramate--alanine ligase